MPDLIHTLDAPYYAGTVTIRPSDVVGIIWGNNGGAALILHSGTHVRVVANEKAHRLAQSAGLS